ncbi:MAG: hypothetical protein IK051_05475 [Rhodocyclaceae bacterium]|nr:hypothetical protein [Rhodocyclaceae bacterium]
MYPIAIAWIFTVAMISLAGGKVLAGIFTFVFAGILPLALFLWIVGTPARRRAKARRTNRREES